MSELRTDLRTALDAAWPETDLSPYCWARQVEFASRWLRQCCSWIEAAHPRAGVLELVLAGELRFREEQRQQKRLAYNEHRRQLAARKRER